MEFTTKCARCGVEVSQVSTGDRNRVGVRGFQAGIVSTDSLICRGGNEGWDGMKPGTYALCADCIEDLSRFLGGAEVGYLG